MVVYVILVAKATVVSGSVPVVGMVTSVDSSVTVRTEPVVILLTAAVNV